MKRLFVLIALLPLLTYSQVKRDTSFTIHSAYEKIKNDYSFAKPAEINQSVLQIKNLVYYRDGKCSLHLDLFLLDAKPKNKKLPCILIIHGGGWRSGHKEMEWPIASRLAAKGFITSTVEYRLSTEALYPTAVLDVKRAIKFLKLNSEKYNIDTNKIVLMGQSAGGQLAALVGVTNKIEKLNIGFNVKVNAIIDIDGVLDITTPSESGKDTVPSKPSAAKQWLGYTYKEKPEIWIEASPLTYIGKDTPPILFINSSIPRFHAGRDEAIEILNKYNIYSEVHTIENTPHTFWLFHPWQDLVIEYVTNFLSKVLDY